MELIFLRHVPTRLLLLLLLVSLLLLLVVLLLLLDVSYNMVKIVDFEVYICAFEFTLRGIYYAYSTWLQIP